MKVYLICIHVYARNINGTSDSSATRLPLLIYCARLAGGFWSVGGLAGEVGEGSETHHYTVEIIMA
jgi:hypothetical protein